jgi:hypothetical protein
VRAAFVHGPGLTLIVSGAPAAAGGILAAFLPPRHTTRRRPPGRPVSKDQPNERTG